MGNTIGCCRQKWSQLDDADDRVDVKEFTSAGYQNAAAVFHNELDFVLPSHLSQRPCSQNLPSKSTPLENVSSSGVTTQHISEREPEDNEFDPTLNASRRALFVTDIELKKITHVPHSDKPLHDPKRKLEFYYPGRLKRWSSCSTAFIGDGCLVNPHQDTTLWNVAIAIELLVKSARNDRIISLTLPSSPATYQVTSDSIQLYQDVYSKFDERKHPISRLPGAKSRTAPPIPEADCVNLPKAADAHQFLKGLFSTSLLGPQCAIVALILLERMLNSAEVGLTPWSWRRQLLACILLSSKVLDDQAVWNTDYCQILRDVSVEDLNALERHTLSLLQFNIDVPLGVYVRYYFDLLAVGETCGMTNRPAERRRLTPELARQLRLLPAFTVDGFRGGDRSGDLNSWSLFDMPNIASQPESPKLIRATGKLSAISKKNKSHQQQRSTNKPSMGKSRSSSADRMNTTATNGSSIPVEVFVAYNAPTPVHYPSSNTTGFAHRPKQSPIVATPAATLKYHPEAYENESPLLVDDETDFINTLTLSTGPPSPLTRRDLQQHWCSGHSQYQPLCDVAPIHSPIHHLSTAFRQSNGGSLPNPQTHNGIQAPSHIASCQNHSTTTSSTCIRSIMGGDVAYSLLRDAGTY